MTYVSLITRLEILPALLCRLSRKHELSDEIGTIYFGGGTPSLLQEDELKRIMEAIHQNYSCSAELESSLEANPEDLSEENLKTWKGSGINRLSVGVIAA